MERGPHGHEKSESAEDKGGWESIILYSHCFRLSCQSHRGVAEP